MIDSDSEGSRREDIIKHFKDVYGEKHILNMATFSTIATRSAIQYAARGLGIDNNESSYINSLLPTDNGNEWSLTDAINGNEKKGREPDKKFIRALEQHPMLKETALGLFGLVVGRSQHASGVAVFNDEYDVSNAMMKTKNGLAVTQFDADDTEYTGTIKFDFLSLDALDRIRMAMNLLKKDHKLEKGSLRDVYTNHFGPNKLDFDNQNMYDKLFNGEVTNAFQFSSGTGNKTLKKLNARKFNDLVSGNGLMRLTGGDGNELPLERYIRYKQNPSDWDTDMDNAGLDPKEKALMHKMLGAYGGVNSSQELLMELVLKTCNYSLEEANKLRKSIAKKDEKKQAQAKNYFYKHTKEMGMSQALIDYIWNEQIAIQGG